jgi:hypothetical protein
MSREKIESYYSEYFYSVTLEDYCLTNIKTFVIKDKVFFLLPFQEKANVF